MSAMASVQYKISPADRARQDLDRDPAAYIREHTIRGHAYESHVAVSDKTLMDNVLSERKLIDTAYSSPQQEEYCTSEILYSNMHRIHEFARTGRPGDKQRYYAEFTDPDTGKPQYVGKGYMSQSRNKTRTYTDGQPIQAVKTSVAAVVVCVNPDAPDGWEITTSFPSARPDIEPVNKDAVQVDESKNLLAIMKQTQTYQAAGPVKKAYIEHALGAEKNEDCHLSYLPYGGPSRPPALQVTMDNRSRTPLARISCEADQTEIKYLSPTGKNGVDVFGIANELADTVEQHVKEETAARRERMRRMSALADKLADAEPQTDTPEDQLE